ncbi:MAG TPA: LamB/YcsF family protein [Gaiellaceae bacterium]|nr:LamB/YcsF family protein [Gaiellaceae bacterium]
MPVDLNADVGEGLSTDAELIQVVTSANVACGFHAGDDATMRTVCAAALERGVTVGAHTSYRDREDFGRRELGVAAATIETETAEQIRALQQHGRVAYVKPHGALYHRASVDAECASAIVAGAAACEVGVMLAFPGSELARAARAAGLTAVDEGFADRGYTAEGALVSRGEPGALLDAEAAARQAVAIADRVESICVHGDSPDAVSVARAVAAALRSAGVELRAFA